ncbi:uncharacterized protein Z520_05847 [Fonsecaea multimorphosa CBS 102226]|uniref:Uncharacterized protein n=1 Tax=Fonsecaea multimorphosa CBS 102226 TaxID=1442371 RepID=A0A0D2INE1_9EURO|nr:uncharacterized protein Z520_05847 [Fonsecaea multimorphosa CBS 102226]KIX98546.1 hypothetical protein Z520_05847 [Fonsecaea multimorphosa CBS 102226]OAL24738.1 hypothetical protein AYO22_05527 [Fonsecaea multimorphosa]
MSLSPQSSVAETEHHIGHLVDSAIHVKDKAKAKTKRLLSPSQPDTSSDDEGDIFSDAAFDPAKVLHNSSPKKTRSTGEAVRDDLKSVKYLATHPRRVMRSKAAHVAAGKLGKRHPALTVDHNKELLDAHDALAQAVSSDYSEADTSAVASELDEAHNRVRKIEQQRESLQTAWILGRHVSRVKAVRPISRPDRSQFRNGERFEWERYLGYMALYYTRDFTTGYIDDFDSPPFDLEDLARIIERIAITSAPWQSFLVNVRHVYMWQLPRRTAKWLALYCVLWYTQHIVGFLYFYIIYSTLRNRFREHSVRTVRESVSRALDREARVQAWGELIQRHGQHDWLEPFLDEIGPIIQLQLGDLANFLEIMLNFHRWERPNLTLASLFFFACCLLITLCADMAFCVKLVWFVFGGGFFLTYPIATNFPKYRLLLSQFRWVFWNIPTHAELAILRLQEKVAAKEEADLREFELRSDDDHRAEDDDDDQSESPPGGATQDGYTFRVYDKNEGRARLVVSRTSLTLFYKSGQKDQTWPFRSLTEMRKLDGVDVNSSSSTLKNLQHLHSQSAEALQFFFLGDAELTVLLHPVDRDRVFNLVLAWSGLRWQCLQMERHNVAASQRSNLDRAIKRAFH